MRARITSHSRLLGISWARLASFAVFTLWLTLGAVLQLAAATNGDPRDWWSFKPVTRPEVPKLSKTDARWARNPIDAFIVAKQREQGLAPSKEADRRTLIRRVYFDLTGLPPKPEEIDAFVADKDPKAYEKLVDRLLESSHYGERWARHWLDVVRYGDTHGYDKDKQRNNAWPYRDYVIRAFNEDKPYGRFVEEQLAGDVLYPRTRDGYEALGFIAAGPWDLIGHMEVPESKIDGKIARNLDRDDMVSNTLNTFTSLTVQCARCHNHKFDPVTQQDYYSLQAVFAAVDRADKKYDLDPDIARQRFELESRQRALTKQTNEIRKAASDRAGEPFKALEEKIANTDPPDPDKIEQQGARGYHSRVAASDDEVKWVQVDLGKTVAISKVVLHGCLDGYNDIGEGFGFPLRFKVEMGNDAEFKTGVIIVADRTDDDFNNPGLSPVSYPADGQSARYVRVTAKKLAPRKDDYIFALAELEVFGADEKNLAKGAAVTSLDSTEAKPRWAVVNLVDGVFPGEEVGKVPNGLAKLKAEREKMIGGAMESGEKAKLAELMKEAREVEKSLGKLPKPGVVYAATVYYGTGAFEGTGPKGGKPRVIQVLNRGDILSPRETVEAGTVPLLTNEPGQFKLPADAPEGERRVALAHWITDARNPLTWRSIVNRVWMYHFGHGIVDSPNDLGHMGRTPTHPELLDWLATEFRDGGQSLKQLQRLIVTSATYRQSSSTGSGSRTAMSRDADNRYLWHMNRRRLEAEAIRDTVLAVSGKLDETMGGPGFQDFVIDKPRHSPHYEYKLHNPEDKRAHRRSIYRFIVRSQPQPFMTTLDCADPAMSVDKRNETMTALQALALLNNQLMVTMSKHFAQRLETKSKSVPAQIEQAYRLALGRAPTASERRNLTDYAKQHGLANACRVIFNLNEFVFID